MSFEPKYSITPKIASNLMVIEGVKQVIVDLPITAEVLTNLRRTARLSATHYSTQIEGNRLTAKEVEDVIERAQHFPDRERDEWEIRGYYAAVGYLEALVNEQLSIREKHIQILHSHVLNQGTRKNKPSPYRDGQNVIRDSRSGGIVYMPPEAKDVPGLMKDLVTWINQSKSLPVPLLAAIAHYQFATVHPYYDGNGRVARLLTTLILHLGGYDLKGVYSLEEYYAQNLGDYYEALTIGPSHNYYLGRETTDITPWVEYFIQGMAFSFQRVKDNATRAARGGQPDSSLLLRELTVQQRKALSLFKEKREIVAGDLVDLFGIKPRTASLWCSQWIDAGFLVVTNASRKARRYALTSEYEVLFH
ncbi:Fic family protein [Planctomycetota bacterium]